MDTRDRDAILKACTRFLTHHYRQAPQEVLRELADDVGSEAREDRYGEGELINGFERRVAELLGKEAAVFMPSGTMCQQIVLRIWSERKGTKNVAFHPTCHLELHERHGYQRLHGLTGILLGSPHRLFTLADLKAVAEPLAALLIELPQREIGGQLPAWEELTAIIDWAREHDVPTHMDGARLWECQPFYERNYAQIAGLFDTVYVSFYKILNGIAGAILAGPADVIAEARIWQRRHGGNLIHMYPYVLSAQRGLEQHLGRMQNYCSKAKEVAHVLTSVNGIEIVPNPPQTNMMHLFLRGEREKLVNAALEVSQETGVWLFQGLMPTPLPDYSTFELVVGDATLDLSNEEIGHLFERLFSKSE
ncbi:MAG: aminotransferase class I/II-fold pyridoxal phosphate-dependent enzyme [Ktedonobacteraceae bacterium]